MRHTHIRTGSKRSEAENDNPNVTPIRDSQPDDPGAGTGVSPKHDAPDTAGAGIAEDVERDARREDMKIAIGLSLIWAAGACVFIGAIWLLVWLAG